MFRSSIASDIVGRAPEALFYFRNLYIWNRKMLPWIYEPYSYNVSTTRFSLLTKLSLLKLWSLDLEANSRAFEIEV